MLIFVSSAYCQESIINVFPENVYNGDAFLITVKTTATPTAIFLGKDIQFFKINDESFIGIGITLMETPQLTHDIMIRADGKQYVAKIAVQKKDFAQIAITLPDEKVFPAEESLKRIREERKTLDEILQKVTPPVWEGNFILPINNGVSTEFGVMRIINGIKNSVHYGIDYKGALDEPIKAVNSGRVVLATNLFFEGNTTIIDHGAGIFSIYMHMSNMTKKTGYLVKKHDIIGYVGKSGRATGPHLHLSIKVNSISVNPESIYALPFSVTK
jgi:murein DD-endopeptidase MepM/ murein hydrolase activator NlpD